MSKRPSIENKIQHQVPPTPEQVIEDLMLADDRFFDSDQQSRPYDLLVGDVYYWKIVGNQNISNFDGLQAIPSLFGYYQWTNKGSYG